MRSICVFCYLDNGSLDCLHDGPGRGKQQQQVNTDHYMWRFPLIEFRRASLVSCSRAEVVECPGWNSCWLKAKSRCVLAVVSMRASMTLAAGKSSEIGRCEVPREESLPGLGIGMTIDDFQIAWILHDVTESLKSAVRYSIAMGPRFFK